MLQFRINLAIQETSSKRVNFTLVLNSNEFEVKYALGYGFEFDRSWRRVYRQMLNKINLSLLCFLFIEGLLLIKPFSIMFDDSLVLGILTPALCIGFVVLSFLWSLLWVPAVLSHILSLVNIPSDKKTLISNVVIIITKLCVLIITLLFILTFSVWLHEFYSKATTGR